MLLKLGRKHTMEAPEVRSDINVTPLVDVCLVLLIIFMVVTPLLQKGVDVTLPATADPEKMAENEKQLEVSVKADGNVFIGQNWVTEENLPSQLEEIHSSNPDRQVVVKADKRLKYKEVRRVMRLLNEAGFTRVGLITEKEGEGA
ncbi:MAG: biopolymer transport protein TolR [Acidobacteriota bacterium]|jgi:TolR protein|nr:biopolymer transport protein TolR [Acidobacteriota bacterium]